MAQIRLIPQGYSKPRDVSLVIDLPYTYRSFPRSLHSIIRQAVKYLFNSLHNHNGTRHDLLVASAACWSVSPCCDGARSKASNVIATAHWNAASCESYTEERARGSFPLHLLAIEKPAIGSCGQVFKPLQSMSASAGPSSRDLITTTDVRCDVGHHH